MHARVTRVDGQPDKLAEGIEQVKSSVLPALEGSQGFKSFSLLVDRATGTMIGVSYWEDEQAIADSEDAIRGPREQAAQATGASDPTVERYEVAIDTQD
jgi:heme-degrading monooxygenase HmoA